MRTALALLLALVVLPAAAARGAGGDDAARLAAYVRTAGAFNRLFPQEKIYLHFDNTGYFKGETIWYKAYVARADSLGAAPPSRVLYVELLNPMGDVIETQKLPIKDGQAHGDFRLDKPMATGFYEVRAYTRYMMNWDGAWAFSRVLPVFARPRRAGYYDEPLIRPPYKRPVLTDHADVRTRDDAPPPLMGRRTRGGTIVPDSSATGRDELCVRFFPEGGQLVRGLTSRVAFEAIRADSAADGLRAALVDSRGDTLAAVSTLREGRGLFACTPDTGRLYLAVGRGRRERLFALPEAAPDGCSLLFDSTDSLHTRVRLAAGPLWRGRTLGLVLTQGGRTVRFDTLSLDERPLSLAYERATLPPGVSQLTLFDSEGRILAERLFFTAPRPDADTIGAISTTPGPVPYGKIGLRFTAPPGSTFSLSVTDADTRTCGDDGRSIRSYLLLGSDLKGYIHRPDYYFEKDDARHRLAADLLTLVQGWRRYDWRVMTGRAPFVKRQPLEDGLYLFGRLHPRRFWGDGIFTPRKRKERAARVGGVRLSATLYNHEGLTMKGAAVSDTAGYYAFALPPCEGEWQLLFKTEREGEAQNYLIGIDRWFSPPARRLSPRELTTAPCSAPPAPPFAPAAPGDTTALAATGGLTLGEATVKGCKEKNPRAAWGGEGSLQESDEVLFYDCDVISEQLYDQGLPQPTVYEWIRTKDFFRRLVAEDGMDVAWTVDDSRRVAYVDTTGIGLRLDEVRSLYVSTRTNVDGASDDILWINMYLHHQFPWKQKGVRRAHFQGYNVPRAFYANDYGVMPREDDFRRTLFWAPDVTADAGGRAEVSFWNNSTCRSIHVSAEGTAPDGTPLTYRPQ